MFIKLTNASSPFQGKSLVIKKENIISIFETTIEVPDENTVAEVLRKETVTTVFCGTIGTWNVKETVDEVYGLL